MTDPLPLSYLSQYGYCPRRAGLLLLEQAWSDNEFTASGSAQHANVHDARVERRGDKLLLMDFPVASERLGVSGKCDCLEAERAENGIVLPFTDGLYQLYPVEYKHGVVREETEYQVQLCAQAICLEEQYGGAIQEGALFFTNAHRRLPVTLDEPLRAKTREVARALWKMEESQRVPNADYSPKCRKCSLLDVCAPKLHGGGQAYRAEILRNMENQE